jgi:putative ABC transport system permease protein
MLKNYVKIAFRNLYLNKAQTLIKTLGLALALTVSIAIFTWIKHELSYDNFHNDADRIYRLVLEDGSVASPPGFKKMFDQIPGIEYSVRLFKSDFLGEKQKVSYQNKVFRNDRIYYADDDFFNVFSFPLVQGDPATVLNKTNSAIITETTAHKYFGNEDPVGKILVLSDEKELEVTGVLKDIPSNSHFHFDILIPLKEHSWWKNIDRINLGSMWVFPTYVKFAKQANISNITEKIYKEMETFQFKPDIIGFQPLKDIHLHSAYQMELEANGDISYIYLFSIVGLLIIVMSSINYINLTTALSIKRIKEIGVRKSIGATKLQLILQLMGESIIISVVSFMLSLVLLELFSSLLVSFVGINFFSGSFTDSTILISAFIFTLLIGALTGLFPAIVLAKQNIINSLKSVTHSAGRKSKSRGALIVFQFCISVALIISSLVIYQQMQYIQNKKLGYDKDHVIVLNLGRDRIVNKIDVLKKSIAENSAVTGVTACSQLPTDIKTAEGFNVPDGTRYEAYYMAVDKDFFKTMGINILKGDQRIKTLVPESNYDPENFNNRFVVNKRLLNKIDITPEQTDDYSILVRHGNMIPGQIIGVVDDFHFRSLHEPIRPLVFEFTPVDQWRNTYLLVKLSSQNIPATINYIKDKWEDVAQGLPFEYYFLDEQYNSLYTTETQTGELFAVFTSVSIFIIILGLLGLIAYVANQKTKEIGIRKVLGASISNVLLLLTRDFIKWILIANIIAWPIAYYLMNKWLEDFAYRIEVNLLIFVLAGAITLLIALTTVSFQAIKAATANPVKSLKYE